jgi:hypothetical protein
MTQASAGKHFFFEKKTQKTFGSSILVGGFATAGTVRDH